MDLPLSIAFLPLLILALLLSAVLLWRWRQRRAATRRVCGQLAEAHGWQVAPTVDPLVPCALSGQVRDVRWTLEVWRPASIHLIQMTGVPYALWRSASPSLAADTLLIIQTSTAQGLVKDRLPGQSALADRVLKRLLMATIATLGLRVDRPDAMQNLKLGIEALRQNFLILATSAPTARRFLTHTVESRLLEWTDYHRTTEAPLTVAITAEGLTLMIGLRSRHYAPQLLLEQLITLGVALSESTPKLS